MDNEKVSSFIATLHKVQTLASGGARVTFDLPSNQIKEAAYLMAVADTTGIVVKVEVSVAPRENPEGYPDEWL